MAYPGEIRQAVDATGGYIDIKPYPELVTDAPTTANKAIGGRIVYRANGEVYIMTNPSTTQWTNLAGGAGSFSSLSVSGAATFSGTTLVDNSDFTVTPDITAAQTTLTPTLNARVGSILVDGSDATTDIPAAGSLTFVISNTFVSATSVVFVTVSSTEAIADVQLSIDAAQCDAGALSVIVTNGGGTGTAGNYNINFWVLS